jgi:hypothetical protein
LVDLQPPLVSSALVLLGSLPALLQRELEPFPLQLAL